MKIEEILSEDLVVPELKGRSKAEVLSELAREVCTHHPELDSA